MDLRAAPPERFSNALDLAHEAAAAAVGAADFGDGDYRVGLRVLLESMEYGPRFTVVGRKRAWGLVVDALAGRAVKNGLFRESK